MTMVTDDNGTLLFPTLFKLNSHYYVWLKKSVSGQSRVKIVIEGQKLQLSFSAKTLAVESRTEDLLWNAEDVLTFSNSQARQCSSSDRNSKLVFKVTFQLLGMQPEKAVNMPPKVKTPRKVAAAKYDGKY
jgi:hypothetical protein